MRNYRKSLFVLFNMNWSCRSLVRDSEGCVTFRCPLHLWAARSIGNSYLCHATFCFEVLFFIPLHWQFAFAMCLFSFCNTPFQTNRDLRSKDLIPNPASKEVRRIRTAENPNQIRPRAAGEASRPRALAETAKTRVRSLENPWEGVALPQASLEA